jgi:hypothetical protein
LTSISIERAAEAGPTRPLEPTRALGIAIETVSVRVSYVVVIISP